MIVVNRIAHTEDTSDRGECSAMLVKSGAGTNEAAVTAMQDNRFVCKQCTTLTTSPSTGLSQQFAAVDLSGTVLNDLEFFQTIRGSKCRLLKFVPKASRHNVAKCFSTLALDLVREPKDTNKWLRLLLFPNICPQKPTRGGKAKRKSLASQINNKIVQFNKNK